MSQRIESFLYFLFSSFCIFGKCANGKPIYAGSIYVFYQLECFSSSNTIKENLDLCQDLIFLTKTFYHDTPAILDVIRFVLIITNAVIHIFYKIDVFLN